MTQSEIQEIFDALDTKNVSSRVEALWDEIHNGTTWREFQDYLAKEGEAPLGIHHPVAAELQAYALFDLFDSVYEIWGPVRRKYARLHETRR